MTRRLLLFALLGLSALPAEVRPQTPAARPPADAAGTAPRLATIDWYREKMKGEIPVNDTLLSATTPGVVDAWYVLLDRWGTMTFEQVLAPAIELAEQGILVTETLAQLIATTKN